MTRHRHVGIVGLGAMGTPMAATLLRAGWEVLIAPRDQARAGELVDAGAVVLPDPGAIAATTDRVVLSLPDAAAVEAVLTGPGGLMVGGRWQGVVIDTSTIDPLDARTLAAVVQAAGGAMVDAPVSGGPGAAAAGTLSIMVGGEPRAIDAAMPVLEDLGSRVVRCGGPGAGQVAKACNQLVVMTTLAAVAETLTLARAGGVDPWAVREALLGGYAASPILENQGARMLRGDFEPGGKARFHAKDIETISRLAADAGIDLPVFLAAASRIRALLATPGGADLDHAAVISTYAGPPT